MHFTNPSIAARKVLQAAAFIGLAAAALDVSAPAQAQSAAARSAKCGNRGADYVAVAGSENCVRLGGHVRVQLGGPVSAYSGPTPDGVQAASERTHVRTDPISSFIQLFPR
jgi:hypothetical protein